MLPRDNRKASPELLAIFEQLVEAAVKYKKLQPAILKDGNLRSHRAVLRGRI